jgi:hypothetical protein
MTHADIFAGLEFEPVTISPEQLRAMRVRTANSRVRLEIERMAQFTCACGSRYCTCHCDNPAECERCFENWCDEQG